jgi:uncharacterized protein YndB with AHSA1/START domain
MNTGNPSIEQNEFSKVVSIDAPASFVWRALTTPALMKKWMMPDGELQIITDWEVGSPLSIRGHMNGKDFENRGKVLQYEFEKTLQYSHLSSISRLPDRPENYSIIEFRLQPIKEQTILTITLSNFPTASIYQHLAFYWNVAPEVLKQMVEKQGSPGN